MVNPRAQIGLWPTPEGGLLVADPRAIKVSGHDRLAGFDHGHSLESESMDLFFQRRYSTRARNSPSLHWSMRFSSISETIS